MPSIGQNVQLLTGNGDVSKMSVKFSNGTKNYKQTARSI